MPLAGMGVANCVVDRARRDTHDGWERGCQFDPARVVGNHGDWSCIANNFFCGARWKRRVDRAVRAARVHGTEHRGVEVGIGARKRENDDRVGSDSRREQSSDRARHSVEFRVGEHASAALGIWWNVEGNRTRRVVARGDKKVKDGSGVCVRRHADSRAPNHRLEVRSNSRSARAPLGGVKMHKSTDESKALRGTAAAVERLRHTYLCRCVVKGNFITRPNRATREEYSTVHAGIRIAGVVQKTPRMSCSHLGRLKFAVTLNVNIDIELNGVTRGMPLQASIDQ